MMDSLDFPIWRDWYIYCKIDQRSRLDYQPMGPHAQKTMSENTVRALIL